MSAEGPSGEGWERFKRRPGGVYPWIEPARTLVRRTREGGAAIDAPDPELVSRIGAGSQDAMAELYARHGKRLYAFALARIRDPALAGDVLSQVMLDVWRGAARFDGRAQVSTWLFSIARNKCVDELRRGRVRASEELDPELPDPGTGDALRVLDDAVRALDDAAFTARLRRCLEGLGDAHREAVHLAFYEDLSCAEIAQVASVPVGTVKTRLFHARRLLKRCLGGAGAEAPDDRA